MPERLDRRQTIKLWSTLFIGTGLVYVSFLAPVISSIDGNSMLAVAESLVTKGDFTVPSDLGIIGRDGQYYSPWYPLLSVFAVPFVALGMALGELFGLPVHYLAAVSALVLVSLLTAGTTSFVALLGVRIGARKGDAVLAAISFGFATIALVYARTFFADTLLAFLCVASLYFAFAGSRRQVAVAATLAGLAVLAKPTGAVLGPILGLYLLSKRRPVHVTLVPVVGTCVGLLLYGTYNYFRFGNPSQFGLSLLAFDTFDNIGGLEDGVLGLLLSPGRGLIFYCPAVVLVVVGFWKAVRSRMAEALAIIALFLAFLLPHAALTNWLGGWSWGPRYLLPALPGLFAVIGFGLERWRKGVLLLSLVGFIVNAPTLVSFYERYYSEAFEEGIAGEHLLWSPVQAPLVRAWGAAYRQTRDAFGTDVKELVQRAGTPDRTVATSQTLRIVAVWWWMLPALGLPRLGGVAIALFLVVIGVRMIVGQLCVNRRSGRTVADSY